MITVHLVFNAHLDQPDCNPPSGFALERQIALGARQFREYFGRVPRIAYKVEICSKRPPTLPSPAPFL